MKFSLGIADSHREGNLRENLVKPDFALLESLLGLLPLTHIGARDDDGDFSVRTVEGGAADIVPPTIPGALHRPFHDLPALHSGVHAPGADLIPAEETLKTIFPDGIAADLFFKPLVHKLHFVLGRDDGKPSGKSVQSRPQLLLFLFETAVQPLSLMNLLLEASLTAKVFIHKPRQVGEVSLRIQEGGEGSRILLRKAPGERGQGSVHPPGQCKAGEKEHKEAEEKND